VDGSAGLPNDGAGARKRADVAMSADSKEPPRDPSGQLVGQVRGILAERVVLSTALDAFLSLTALAGYSCISVRKLRQHLDDAAHPLPHYRIGGKIVVRRSEFDAWIVAYRRIGQADVGGLVDSVLRDLRGE
jgi:hypothetical protein